MPSNALTVADEPKRILLLGDTGSGKTTQFLTLEGKKYMHIFDPNALSSLKGYDLDYDLYLPSRVSAAAASLKSGKADSRSTVSSTVYQNFETEFDQRLQSGFFDQYDWLGFDSITTLLELIMDRILTINGRFGQWPHEDDWGPQMIAFTNICRTVTGMGKKLFITGHMQDKQNRKLNTVRRVPMMTGSLIQRIPLLFSDILGCDTDKDEKGSVVYQLVTVRDAEFTVIRTSMRGLNPVEPATIKWYETDDKGKPVKPLSPIGQGLGGILNWAERNPLGQEEVK